MNAQRRGEEKRRKKAREIGIVLNKWRNAQRNSTLLASFALSFILSPIWQFSAFTLACAATVVVITCCPFVRPFVHEYCRRRRRRRFCNLKFLFVSLSPSLLLPKGRRYLAFLAVLIDQYPDGGSARDHMRR